jgi:hypothetical protein
MDALATLRNFISFNDKVDENVVLIWSYYKKKEKKFTENTETKKKHLFFLFFCSISIKHY